ncbi:hypothetical protein QOT17_006175 [Balamuthia mandrillaris]
MEEEGLTHTSTTSRSFSAPTRFLRSCFSASSAYSKQLHSTHDLSSPSPSLPWQQLCLRARPLLVNLSIVLVQLGFAVMNVSGKLSLSSFHPMVFMLLRMWLPLPLMLLAFFFLEGSGARSMAVFLERRNVVTMLVVSFFGMFLNQSTYVWGLQNTTATNAATIYLSIPIWTTVICCLFRGEPKTLLKFLGVGTAIIGALIMLRVEQYTLSGSTLIGDAIILLQTFIFSIYLIWVKPMTKDLPSCGVTFWMFFLTGLFVLPSVPFLQQEWSDLFSTLFEGDNREERVQLWVMLVVAILLGTAMPYLLMIWVLQYASPVTLAVYIPLELLMTAVMAGFWLGESFGLRQGFGAVIILVGLFVVTWAKMREAAASKATTMTTADITTTTKMEGETLLENAALEMTSVVVMDELEGRDEESVGLGLEQQRKGDDRIGKNDSAQRNEDDEKPLLQLSDQETEEGL